MLEKFCDEAREDLRLGLLSPTIGRQLVRLPAGNQAEALAAARRESLTAGELRGVVDLLLASGTREKTAFVAYGQNRYSVPWSATRPGQLLPVKITDQAVIIYGPRLEELARHVRFPATVTHQDRQLPAHRPPRDQQRRRGLLQQRYAQLGEAAGKFLEGLLQSQRNGWQQAEKVLALLATYRSSDFQAALERAVRYGAFSLSAVQRILAVQAQPKSCLEQLAEQATERLPDALRTPATPPRPPADHQPLLFPEKASPI